MLIEKINDAFIDFLRDYRGTRYAEYFKEINNRLILLAPNITNEDVRGVISDVTLDVSDVAIFGVLLGSITSIINERPTGKQRQKLLPIIAIMSIFSLRNPKLFVAKIQSAIKNPKTANDLKVHNLINDYKKRNARAIETFKQQEIRELAKAQRKAKYVQSKLINARVSKMIEEGVPLDAQKTILQRQYNASKVISRAIDTEIHAGLERAKTIAAKVDGFTLKEWRTQGDNRVRDTKFHNHVNRRTIPINDDYNLGNKQASAPGDIRLPPGERINCRCYLVFK